MARKTVRLVIIGNEVLSGKVTDTNTPFLLGRLRQLGAVCTGVRIVADEPDEIAGAVLDASARADVVITTGGVGPTHDDITMESIASAFGVAVEEHPELLSALQAHLGEEMTGAQRRLAHAPAGSRLVPGPYFPTVVFRNVFILPGIPALVRSKVEVLAPELRGERLPCAAVRTSLRETELAPLLEAALAAAPGAELGSYPRKGEDGWRVLVTVEGEDRPTVDRGVRALLDRLPDEAVVEIVNDFHPEDSGGLGE